MKINKTCKKIKIIEKNNSNNNLKKKKNKLKKICKIPNY